MRADHVNRQCCNTWLGGSIIVSIYLTSAQAMPRPEMLLITSGSNPAKIAKWRPRSRSPDKHQNSVLQEKVITPPCAPNAVRANATACGRSTAACNPNRPAANGASSAWICGPLAPIVTMSSGTFRVIRAAKHSQFTPRSYPPTNTATRRRPRKQSSAAKVACGVVLIESLTQRMPSRSPKIAAGWVADGNCRRQVPRPPHSAPALRVWPTLHRHCCHCALQATELMQYPARPAHPGTPPDRARASHHAG